MADHFLLRRDAVNQTPHVVVEHHQLVDAGPAAITLLVALRATTGAIQDGSAVGGDAQQLALRRIRLVGLLAVRAEHPNQALGQHTLQG
ncbi:hypothetical protein D3C80_2066170 [compost metagenome]